MQISIIQSLLKYFDTRQQSGFPIDLKFVDNLWSVLRPTTNTSLPGYLLMCRLYGGRFLCLRVAATATRLRCLGLISLLFFSLLPCSIQHPELTIYIRLTSHLSVFSRLCNILSHSAILHIAYTTLRVIYYNLLCCRVEIRPAPGCQRTITALSGPEGFLSHVSTKCKRLLVLDSRQRQTSPSGRSNRCCRFLIRRGQASCSAATHCHCLRLCSAAGPSRPSTTLALSVQGLQPSSPRTNIGEPTSNPRRVLHQQKQRF